MAKRTVVLKESERLLQELASVIHAHGKTYYFMPYWFEKTDEPDVFIVHSLEQSLPGNLQEVILNNRNGNTDRK